MAPDGFESVTFDELIVEGALEIGDGYRAKNEELGGDGLIFLRAGHVTDTHVDFEGAERFHRELEQRLRGKVAQAGDAVVTTKGNSTGRTAFVSADMPAFVYSPHLSYWRSRNGDRVEPGFLRYWSKSREFGQQLAGMKVSTDMAPYLSLSDQKRLRITLPPIGQQRAIAGVLGVLDDKIELNWRMSETLEQIARTEFRSRFEHPAEVGPLNTVASQSRDAIDPQERPLDQFDLYSIPAFDDGRRPECRTGAEIKSQKFVVRANSVLVSKLNPRIPRVWWPVVGAERTPICSTEFVVLTPANGTSREFLFAVTSDPSFSRELEAGVTGTSGSHQRVRPETVMATEIPIPSAEEMRRFTEIVAPLYARANLARAESATLAALRDALLPKLISGELRIPTAA
jgi:type I restriction enzyme S subunit